MHPLSHISSNTIFFSAKKKKKRKKPHHCITQYAWLYTQVFQDLDINIDFINPTLGTLIYYKGQEEKWISYIRKIKIEK